MAEAKKQAKKRKKKLPKLGVSCTDSRCDKGLHCFRPKRGMTADESVTTRTPTARTYRTEPARYVTPRAPTVAECASPAGNSMRSPAPSS